MAVNIGKIVSLTRPGLHTVFWDYERYPAIWRKIYDQFMARYGIEYDEEMQPLPLAQIKQDGAPAFNADFQEAYKTSYLMQFYAITSTITRGSIEDNLYPDQFPQQALMLRHSLDNLKNVNAAFLFNNAFDVASTVSDGQPLCSTVHPTSIGTLANTFENGVQLNEAALEDAITLIKAWTDVAGIKTNIGVKALHVPTSRYWDATRILKSEYRTGTANNDISVIYHDKLFSEGIIVNQFINNPNYWFIHTNVDVGFKYFLKTPLDIDFINDVYTDNVTVRAVERYSFGCSNWRAVFGSRGA